MGHVADLGELDLGPVIEVSNLPTTTSPKYSNKTELILPDTEVKDDFVWSAMQRAYDPDTNMVRDLKIDDSDLRLADNYYDFCANLAGRNLKMPFARQLWVATILCAEYCPRCTKPQWYESIENTPVDMDPHDLAKKFVLLKKGICPKCKVHKSELVLKGELNDYYELVLVFGQRAGKSIFTATLVNYVIHRLLKLPKLSTISRGIQDITPLTGTFVAITATKAVKLLWDPIRNMVASSAWMTQYFSLLDEYGRRYGKEFYQFAPTGTYLRFFHRNLDFYPEGPGKRTLRGPTRVLGALDELGHFPFKIIGTGSSDEEDDGTDDERERANADEVHQVLTNSLSTVRSELPLFYKQDINHVPQGFLINISSPASHKDKIMRLLKESEGSTTVLGLNYPTWEISPIYSRDHPVIRDMYKRNPKRAERDFGANPPKLSSSVFDKLQLNDLFVLEAHHAITYSESESRTLGKLVVKKEGKSFPPSVMVLDAGATNNSYAMTILYKEGEQVKSNTVLEVIPQKGKRIDFFYIYQNTIKPLIEACNVKCVAYDRWNSLQVLDQIHDDFKGKVKTLQYTLKSKDFNAFHDLVVNQRILLPERELPVDRIEAVLNYKKELMNYPVSHLYLQFLTVQEIGGVWYKGDGFTDDLLRCLVLASALIYNPKVTEHLSKFKSQERTGVSNRAVVLLGGRTTFGNTFTP